MEFEKLGIKFKKDYNKELYYSVNVTIEGNDIIEAPKFVIQFKNLIIYRAKQSFINNELKYFNDSDLDLNEVFDKLHKDNLIIDYSNGFRWAEHFVECDTLAKYFIKK